MMDLTIQRLDRPPGSGEVSEWIKDSRANGTEYMMITTQKGIEKHKVPKILIRLR
jgi:hypothetical protein